MFRGVLSDAGVRAQDADFVVLDELDAAAPERVALAPDRILASDLAWLAYLSTPTFPETGVAALFEQSDQRRWHVRCDKCRWEGDLLDHFPECLNADGRVCPGCGGPVDVRYGRWVPTAAGRDGLVGYQISHLITPLAASEILRKYETAERSYEVQRFHNSVLGVPYVPEGASLTEADLNAATDDVAMAFNSPWSVAGVDVGDDLHAAWGVTDGGVLRVIRLAVLASFEELARALGDMKTARAVIDAMPYKASAVRLAADLPGVVTLAYFSPTAFRLGLEAVPGGAVSKLNLERTAALDRTVAYIREGRLRLPPPRYPEVEQARRHLLTLRRVTAERPDGSLVSRWVSAGADHFAFALTYLVAAWELGPGGPPGTIATAQQRRF